MSWEVRRKFNSAEVGGKRADSDIFAETERSIDTSAASSLKGFTRRASRGVWSCGGLGCHTLLYSAEKMGIIAEGIILGN